MKLSRDLLSSYGNIISAGAGLEQKVNALQDSDAEIYALIVEAAQLITARVKAEKDTFMLLAKNFMALSIRIREIIGDITSLEVSGGLSGTGAGSSLTESPDEKGIVDGFFDGLFSTKTLELVDPAGGQYDSWIDARDILGIFHNDNVDATQFWSHHGESKDRFFELASHITTVKTMLDQGLTLDQIGQNDELSACVAQYFSPDRAVKVYKYGSNYIFLGEGRHRVRIAQEMGLKIPVIIYKETLKK